MTELTKEKLAELEALNAEVDRLSGHFVDGGCKSMGVAQQLTYAEDELGAKMVEHRHLLIAAARELAELKDSAESQYPDSRDWSEP